MSLDNLPVEWLRTSIENIAEVIAGGTPKANDSENFVEPPNGIGWLTPADLSGYSNKYIGHGKRDLSEKGYNSSSAKLMPKGSVVFSSRAPIGYVAIALNEISTNQGFKNFVIDQNISSEYLYYYLKSIRDLAESLGTGTTFKELSGSACKKLPFVLAPLAEQQEIVRQLDVMLAQVEQIKARLDAIPAILKKFRQSVLADAVSGKLTEEWRGTSDLSDWQKKYLEEITHRITYGLTKRPPYVEEGIPVISAKEIRSGCIDFNVANQISESDFGSLREKCKIFEGDVLFSKTGSIGHVAIYKHSRPSASSQNIAVITPKLDDINNEYLYCYLKSPLVQNLAQQSVKANAIPDLQLGIISKFTIKLPPIIEQQEIVRMVNTLFSYAETIEKTVQSAQKLVNLLTQSILAKAFSGELTAEWREQHQELITGVNSAQSLLAKIQAEREATKPVKKTRAKKEV